MRVKTWRILDRGTVPENASTIPYVCRCGYEAELPVQGRAIALMAGGGVVFDPGDCAIPPLVQCRRCRRILTIDDDVPESVG